jgi:hypothetical protein
MEDFSRFICSGYERLTRGEKRILNAKEKIPSEFLMKTRQIEEIEILLDPNGFIRIYVLYTSLNLLGSAFLPFRGE